VANCAILIKALVADLEAANRALAARKKRQKQRIQRQGTLTQATSNSLINVLNDEQHMKIIFIIP
jgi:hypothetical protein